MLSLNETMHQLSVVSSVIWYDHVSKCENADVLTV